MDEHELDRILVVEDDRLVGIISEADIRSDEGPLGGATDTVRGATDKPLGGGGKEEQR
jgi:CBS domain-containing protein